MSFWDMPMTASRDDPIVGEDELGRPIYQSIDGTIYGAAFAEPQAQPQPRDYSNVPSGSAVRRQNRQREAQYGWPEARQAASALAQSAWQGISAPGRALRGEPVTYGDVAATALDWGVLGAPMRAPAGALRAGGVRKGKGIRAYHGSPDPDDFEYIGYRTVDSGHDPLEPSRLWAGGEPTDDLLEGVSVTDENYPFAQAMHGMDKPNYQEGYYFGDETFRIGGNVAEYGEDAGELIIKDPVLLEKMVRKYGIAGAAAMLGMSQGELEDQAAEAGVSF